MCIRIIGLRDATPGEKALYRKTQMTTEQDKSLPILEHSDLGDVPEIPANAKLVTMQSVIDRLTTMFNNNRLNRSK